MTKEGYICLLARKLVRVCDSTTIKLFDSVTVWEKLTKICFEKIEGKLAVNIENIQRRKIISSRIIRFSTKDVKLKERKKTKKY